MKKCVDCGTEGLIGIEYDWTTRESYDGISEWECPACGSRRGRWTGEKIPDGYVESRFGQRGVVIR